jgi:two-component system sensor histidine kinase BaeS
VKRRWARSTLTARTILITCLVALVSVAITAAVALPLTVRSANSDARLALAGKARVAANAIGGRDTTAAQAREDQRAQRVAQALREQGIQTVLIRDGKPDQAGLPPKIVPRSRTGSR